MSNPLPSNPIQTVSVVICAYNEAPTIAKVIETVRKLSFVTEIVVVDNGSTDKTGDIIRAQKGLDPRVVMVEIKKNRGLGIGLVAGIQRTTGDVVVRQDADLEYDPNEIMEVIDPILRGLAHVSYGSRMLVRKTHKAQYYYNYLANVLFTFLADLIINMNLTDVETASKAFLGSVIRDMKFHSPGFEIEIEMTFRLKQIGAVFYEVPISYYGRSVEEGKKIRFVDAIHTLWAILKFGFLCTVGRKLKVRHRLTGTGYSDPSLSRN